jgi:hypothetical protein
MATTRPESLSMYTKASPSILYSPFQPIANLVSVFLEVNIFRIAIPRQPHGQVIFRVEQPGIPGVGREQRQGTDRYEAPIMLSGAALDVSDLIGEMEVLAIDLPLTRPVFDGLPAH